NYDVNENDNIEIINKWKYVSRAGYKLEQAIEYFKIDFNNKVVLDIGASTGGFVDCALKNNAKFVYALDVGVGQLDVSLRNNKQVANIENTNIKDINNIVFEKIDIITCDVSFISLKHVFSNIIHLIDNDTIMIFLIKPQFELNSKIIKDNNWCVKLEKDRLKVIENVKRYAIENGIKLIEYIESNIKGAKTQNIEYLGLFKKI
ncbi:MAG: TlyA family RNA methyltransferase, partial [Ureaplasma sp.]|nr:TlyA family RNA methyltransferase [Ureaplasma sp.]